MGVLEWIVVAGPIVFAFIIEGISKDVRESKRWRAGVLIIGAILSALISIQLYKARQQHVSELGTANDQHEQEMSTIRETHAQEMLHMERDNGELRAKLDALRTALSSIANHPASYSRQEVAQIIAAATNSKQTIVGPDPYPASDAFLLSEVKAVIDDMNRLASNYSTYFESLARGRGQEVPADGPAEMHRQMQRNNLLEAEAEYPRIRAKAAMLVRSLCARMKIEPPQPEPAILLDSGDKIPFSLSNLGEAKLYLETLARRFRNQ